MVGRETRAELVEEKRWEGWNSLVWCETLLDGAGSNVLKAERAHVSALWQNRVVNAYYIAPWTSGSDLSSKWQRERTNVRALSSSCPVGDGPYRVTPHCSSCVIPSAGRTGSHSCDPMSYPSISSVFRLPGASAPTPIIACTSASTLALTCSMRRRIPCTPVILKERSGRDDISGR